MSSGSRLAVSIALITALLVIGNLSRDSSDTRWSKKAAPSDTSPSSTTNVVDQITAPQPTQRALAVELGDPANARPSSIIVRVPSGLNPEIDSDTKELPKKSSITLYEQSPNVLSSRGCAEIAAKKYSKAGLMKLSGWGKTAVPMWRQGAYKKIMGCLGDAPMFRRNESSEYWSTRAAPNGDDDKNPNVTDPWSHPTMNIIAGGVTPFRALEHGYRLGVLMGLPDYILEITALSLKYLPKDKVLNRAKELFKQRKEAVAAGDNFEVETIVELGCGNGAVLSTICPPFPGVQCYGSDIGAGLIEYGRKLLPNIKFEVGIRSKSAPCASAQGVLSNGVFFYLDAEDACNHIRETLRIAKPNASIVFYGINSQPFLIPKYPSFFAEHRPDGSSAALQFCTGNLAALTHSVEVIAVHHMPIFPANLYDNGFYGVRIIRNDVPYPSKECEGRRSPQKTLANEEGMLSLLERHAASMHFAALQRTPQIRTRVAELRVIRQKKAQQALEELKRRDTPRDAL